MAGNCGRQYLKKYIERAQPDTEPSGALSTNAGVLLHDIAEKCIVTGSQTQYDWRLFVEKDMLMPQWGAVLRGKDFTQAEMDILMERRSGLEKVLSQIFAFTSKYQLKVQVEDPLIMDKVGNMRGNCPWPDRAYIGYVDFSGVTPDGSSVLFSDFKSHFKPKAPYPATVLQKKFYYYFLFKKYDKAELVQGGTSYIPSGAVVMDETPMLRSHVPALEEELCSIIADCLKDVANGVYTTNKGKYCEWCGWYNSCPEHQVTT